MKLLQTEINEQKKFHLELDYEEASVVASACLYTMCSGNAIKMIMATTVLKTAPPDVVKHFQEDALKTPEDKKCWELLQSFKTVLNVTSKKE